MNLLIGLLDFHFLLLFRLRLRLRLEFFQCLELPTSRAISVTCAAAC